MTREIKYRQKLNDRLAKALGESFHYWGFIDGGFVSPVGKSESVVGSEQYTGLKDKNGVEIYEGDIISGLVVTYVGDLDGSLGMNCGWYLQRDDFEAFTKLVCEEDNEVIGNIYQNPELLEGGFKWDI